MLQNLPRALMSAQDSLPPGHELAKKHSFTKNPIAVFRMKTMQHGDLTLGTPNKF